MLHSMVLVFVSTSPADATDASMFPGRVFTASWRQKVSAVSIVTMTASIDPLPATAAASSSTSYGHQHARNPIEPVPSRALLDSYTYHSPLPARLNEDGGDEAGWMMGIDEAGRGRESWHPFFSVVAKY